MVKACLISYCALLCSQIIIHRSSVCCESIFPETNQDEGQCRDPNEPCIPIIQCEHILRLIKNDSVLTQETANKLQRYHCGFDGNTVKVCCPNPMPTSFTLIPDMPNEFEDHPHMNLLPLEDCGPVFRTDLHYKGNETDLFFYPWMALLTYRTSKGFEFLCAGTIISERYILTTASCISHLNGITLLGVRVGDYDITEEVDCKSYSKHVSNCLPPHQDLAIEEAIPHPNYNRITYQNDIGLVRVLIPINMSLENVLPICLPFGGHFKNHHLTKTNAVVTGWGVTDEGFVSKELLQFVVPIRKNEACENINNFLLDDKQFCAGGINGRVFCGGDVGSPVQDAFRWRNQTRVVQLGILSYKSKLCGKKDRPSVYTRVADYTGWILDTIRPNGHVQNVDWKMTTNR